MEVKLANASFSVASFFVTTWVRYELRVAAGMRHTRKEKDLFADQEPRKCKPCARTVFLISDTECAPARVLKSPEAYVDASEAESVLLPVAMEDQNVVALQQMNRGYDRDSSMMALRRNINVYVCLI